VLATFLTVVAALAVAWLLLVALVFAARPRGANLASAVRLFPDTIRLVRRLATDTDIKRRTRWLVWALLAYLASPIDIVPDVVPVIGFADDAIITSLVLRHVMRVAGPGKLEQHWPGSEEGLDALARLLRLPPKPQRA